jgi:hypothetical protein
MMGHWESIGQSDEWYTPKSVFDALGEYFDLDVAAPAHGLTHVPAKSFITEDSLDKQWHGFIWMNPPFGTRNALVPWLAKFFAHGNGIALVPDRTSAEWFRQAWSQSSLALFTPKLQFHRPDGTVGKSPSTGTTLFAAGTRAERALRRAAAMNLGILGRPEPAPLPDDRDARVLRLHEMLRQRFDEAGGGFSEMTEAESIEISRVIIDRYVEPRASFHRGVQ